MNVCQIPFQFDLFCLCYRQTAFFFCEDFGPILHLTTWENKIRKCWKMYLVPDYLFTPLWPLSPHLRESKTVLDSGFDAVDSGFQVMDSALCHLNLDSESQSWEGFRGFLELLSGFQSPGSRIPQAKISWIPESGLPYMGRPLVWQQIAWWTLPRARSINCSRRSPGKGSVEGSVQFNYWALLSGTKRSYKTIS